MSNMQMHKLIAFRHTTSFISTNIHAESLVANLERLITEHVVDVCRISVDD